MKFMMSINGILIIIAITMIYVSISSAQATEIIENGVGRNRRGPRKENCTANDHCQSSDRCVNNVCVPVCKSISCGINANCMSINRTPVCFCYFGYLGDPLEACKKTKCDINSDCEPSHRCHHNVCIPACLPHWCARDAKCEIKDHLPICVCKDGSIADPFISCELMNEINQTLTV